MYIGTKLRKLRERQGYSQEYVANSIGISQSTYHKLEAEQIRLTVERAKQLADLYEIDPEYFYASEAKAVYFNSGESYNASLGSTIEKKGNSDEKFYTELFALLREELAQSRKERENLATLVEKLLNMKNGQP